MRGRFDTDSLEGQENYRRAVRNWAAESREVVGAEAIAQMTAAEVDEAIAAYWQDELMQTETAQEQGESVSSFAELEALFKATFRHDFLFLVGSDDGISPTGWVGEQERAKLRGRITATSEHWAAQMQMQGKEVTAVALVAALREREAGMIANFVYTSDDDIRRHILDTILSEVAAQVAGGGIRPVGGQ